MRNLNDKWCLTRHCVSVNICTIRFPVVFEVVYYNTGHSSCRSICLVMTLNRQQAKPQRIVDVCCQGARATTTKSCTSQARRATSAKVCRPNNTECVSDCSNGVRSCYVHVHYFVKCIRIQQKKCTWTPYSIFPVHVAKILSMCLACDDVLLPLCTCSEPVVNVIVVTLLVPMPMATSQYLVAQLMTKRSRPG